MEQGMVMCPGCSAKIIMENQSIDKDFNASSACRALYYNLSYYTLSLQDNGFIHQLAVDTYAAQHGGNHMKPITLAFALIGLYLVCEKEYTGRQVQIEHIRLAKLTKKWPQFTQPSEKSPITIQTVLQSSESKRKEMIHTWTCSVWDLWKNEHQRVKVLLEQ